METKLKFYLQFKGRTETVEYEYDEETNTTTIDSLIIYLYENTLKNETKKTDILLLKKNNKYLNMDESISTEIESEDTIVLEILSHVEEFNCGKSIF
jgi:hypothetical protein